MKKLITILTIGLLFGFTFIIFQQTDTSHVLKTEKVKAVHKQTNASNLDSSKITILESNESTITHEEIAAIMDKFMETLVQEVDDQYRVVQFDSKETLISEFEPIAAKEVVQPYIDYYFEEKDNKLYINPTETPAWFVEDNEYNKKEISDKKVEITQANVSDLYGPYTIKVLFEKNEGQWKITNISH
ncbi:hypothetical protein [Gracilibacillus xinjiangensis]|uniref:DUF3993 domain-containing protein n=1 Tax=Gracilibacillus xinjiangensis TaxID=1193282 RepID=A0ABV8WZJ5_9BACI